MDIVIVKRLTNYIELELTSIDLSKQKISQTSYNSLMLIFDNVNKHSKVLDRLESILSNLHLKCKNLPQNSIVEYNLQMLILFMLTIEMIYLL